MIMTKKAETVQWTLEVNEAIRRLTQAIRLIWQNSPAWSMASFILLSIQGVLPLLALYIMKLVIDAISAAIKSPNIGLARLSRFKKNMSIFNGL
jgi:hypothetical protein